MGCDIHFYVERREGGCWVSCDTWAPSEYVEDDEAPHNTVPYGRHFYDQRNYDTFAILADVHNGRGFAGIDTGDGFVPIAAPRGLPDDMSPELAAEAERYMDHTPSWLTVHEIMEYDWTQTTKKRGWVTGPEFMRWAAWGRLHGFGPQGYCGDVSGGGVVKIATREMEKRIIQLGTRERVDAELGSTYCLVVWETPYYRAASTFLAETLPRLWRLGAPQDVRCVFWFDS